MAIIVEACPKCGHDLVNVMLDSYPSIPKKELPELRLELDWRTRRDCKGSFWW